MSKLDRRQFLGAAVASASAVSLAGCARPHSLERSTVILVSDAVLPDELGADGVARITDEFLDWVAGYAPGAELNHAYGSGNLAYAAELPVALWIEQTVQLNTAARDRFSRSLNNCTKEERRQLLQDALDGFPQANLGSPARAEHLGIAILSFFYDSAEATDLAYGASIKKLQCRPLESVANQPVRLG